MSILESMIKCRKKPKSIGNSTTIETMLNELMATKARVQLVTTVSSLKDAVDRHMASRQPGELAELRSVMASCVGCKLDDDALHSTIRAYGDAMFATVNDVMEKLTVVTTPESSASAEANISGLSDLSHTVQDLLKLIPDTRLTTGDQLLALATDYQSEVLVCLRCAVHLCVKGTPAEQAADAEGVSKYEELHQALNSLPDSLGKAKTSMNWFADSTEDMVEKLLQAITNASRGALGEADTIVLEFENVMWEDQHETLKVAMAALDEASGAAPDGKNWKDDFDGDSLADLQRHATKTVFTQRGLSTKLRSKIDVVDTALKSLKTIGKTYKPKESLSPFEQDVKASKKKAHITLTELAFLQLLRKPDDQKKKIDISDEFDRMADWPLKCDDINGLILAAAQQAQQ